jgi:hypothetical protein
MYSLRLTCLLLLLLGFKRLQQLLGKSSCYLLLLASLGPNPAASQELEYGSNFQVGSSSIKSAVAPEVGLQAVLFRLGK